MNIAGVRDYLRPANDEQARQWKPGCAFVAGGTWLYSEPQMAGRITPGQPDCRDAPGIDTIVDLTSLDWVPIQATDSGLEIAATCRIQELLDYEAPSHWPAGQLFSPCAQALSASFKIFNEATVGGNICMSLPAGSMISLATALHAEYTIWPCGGEPVRMPSIEFHRGILDNALNPGDLLRSIHIPAAWLKRRAIMDLRALTHIGRSAALVVATEDMETKEVEFSFTASVTKPYQVTFDQLPAANELEVAIKQAIPKDAYFDDQHGDVFYREVMTQHLAENLRSKLEDEVS